MDYGLLAMNHMLTIRRQDTLQSANVR